MEGFFEGLGAIALIALALVGLVIGWLAGLLTGRNRMLFAAIGAVAAFATPFLLGALGIIGIAAGGVLLVVLVGAVGAAVVLGIVGVIGRKQD